LTRLLCPGRQQETKTRNAKQETDFEHAVLTVRLAKNVKTAKGKEKSLKV